jgi:hypothetical protein
MTAMPGCAAATILQRDKSLRRPGHYVRHSDAIRASAPPLVQKPDVSCTAPCAGAAALAAAAHNAPRSPT